MGNRKRNKTPKTQVVFNADDRAKYLLGFRKRKLERKERAKEELENQIKLEKKRQRDLKAQALMEERKKGGLPIFGEVKVTSQDIIETEDNTIIISDFASKRQNVAPTDDEDEDDNADTKIKNGSDALKKSEQHDAVINQSKQKINKECSLITERLAKLEKHQKTLLNQNSKSKLKKNLIKSKQSSKNCKSTRKFNIQKTRIKHKEKRTTKKK